jgi:hypothetical protein
LIELRRELNVFFVELKGVLNEGLGALRRDGYERITVAADHERRSWLEGLGKRLDVDSIGGSQGSTRGPHATQSRH